MPKDELHSPDERLAERWPAVLGDGEVMRAEIVQQSLAALRLCRDLGVPTPQWVPPLKVAS